MSLALFVVPRLCWKFSLLASIQRAFFIPFLHLVHVKDAQGRWFLNMFFVRVHPNHETIVLYLMLTDERCLNSLLSLGLLPSTSAHLLWKQGLESYEYLEACSH
jgi:hypothetical protein